MDAANKMKPTVLISAVPELTETRLQPNTPQSRAPVLTRKRRGRRADKIRGKTARRAAIMVLLAAMPVASGCSKRVLLPPRIDLAPYRPVGLVTFTMENAQGDLNKFATDRFASEIFAGQDNIQILELGDAERLLDEVGHDEFDARAALDLRFPRVEATVTVEISVRLVSTETGAMLWRNQATASDIVGEVGLAHGQPYFSADDPDNAYGRLIDRLIHDLTWDFRPMWVRQ